MFQADNSCNSLNERQALKASYREFGLIHKEIVYCKGYRHVYYASHCLDLAAHVGDCNFEVDFCGWKSLAKTSINTFRLTAFLYVKQQHPTMSFNVGPWYRTRIRDIDVPALKGKETLYTACMYLSFRNIVSKLHVCHLLPIIS